jgi:hypothetical protein
MAMNIISGGALAITCGLFLAAATWAATEEASNLKPFVMPALEPPGERVDLRAVFAGPRGEALPPVAVKDGHFFAGGQRVRFWGVNFCFGANFPPHDVADKVAARLAGFGVNCVRFHHMDNQQYPDGIWDKDFKRLSPEALDRLDYLLAALKREGVYANLNLHVSRDYAKTGGAAGKDELPEYGKRADLFDPQLIELQKQYARDLLGHTNAYTKLKYADDPVVALVEITNEDSLFMTWAGWGQDDYAPRFEAELVQLWNAALKTKYKMDEALRKAWSAGEELRGAEMLQPAGFTAESLGTAWKLAQIQEATMSAEVEAAPDNRAASGVLHLKVEKITSTAWHLQLQQAGLKMEKGRAYTIRFRARADKARPIDVTLQQQADPWRTLARSMNFDLTPQWKDYEAGFVANENEANTKLAFIVGQATGDVWLAQVSLMPGGRLGLREGESLEKKNVARLRPGELATAARLQDYLLFLADTERRYFGGMRDFLHKELGVKAPVTGTIGLGLLGPWVQSSLDFVDSHNYWQHPYFPHRSWDSRDWTIPNTAMVDAPERSTLVDLAGHRMLYSDNASPPRPFTVTEYNHSSPSDYQAEGIPMIASFAAAQDWDGVFLFAYSHSRQWQSKAMTGFFDIAANPVKMAQMAAGALLFRRGDIAPLPVSVVTGLPVERMADLTARRAAGGEPLTANPEVAAWPVWRFFGRYALAPFAMTPSGAPATRLVQGNEEFTLPKVGPRGEVADSKAPLWKSAGGALWWKWSKTAGSGVYAAKGEQSVALVGFIAGKAEQVGPTEIAVAGPKFAAITLSALDGRPLESSRRILITAAARIENTGQKWNDTRTSVADQWGTGPTLIEPVRGEITLNHVAAQKARLVALGGDGKPLKEWPVESKGTALKLVLPGDPATVWYILEIE